jgi:ribose transport system ATP-binding protein
MSELIDETATVTGTARPDIVSAMPPYDGPAIVDRRQLHLGRWMPILAMIGLILALGLYTYSRDSAFGSSYTLNFLLVQTMPLALAAMGQCSALMVKAFDVSVGALVSICLVTCSFVITPGDGWPSMVLGVLIVMAIALGVGGVNVFLIRVLGLSSIIATLATMTAMEGTALLLRPQPQGSINSDFVDLLLTKVGFVPVAFIVIVVGAIASDIWLYRSAGGLAARAAGLDEVSAARRGVRVTYLFTRAFFIVSLAAAMASFFLGAYYQIGDPAGGKSFTLTSIAAAVLGGASLLGGRGSFVGAVVGALFLNMIITVLPYLGWSSSRGQIMVGVFTLLALTFYQAPELLDRVRKSMSNASIARAKVAGTE